MKEGNPLRDDVLINRFELRLEDGVAEGKHLSDGKLILYSGIWVDGQVLDEIHFIDLPLLIQSLHAEGEFDIFTCGCGVSGCAEIFEGIHVTHDCHSIKWRMCTPVPYEVAMSQEECSAGYDPNKHIDFVFDRHQVIQSIHSFLDTVRKLVAEDYERFDWPVHGFNIRELLIIDPDKPYCDPTK